VIFEHLGTALLCTKPGTHGDAMGRRPAGRWALSMNLVVEGSALKCSRSWLHCVRGHESGYSLSIFVTIKAIARLRRTAKPP